MADSSAREAYLQAVAGELELPSNLEADVLVELRDHIADATEALVAEGLDDGRAEREALARLGSPTDLAAQLRRAQQTQKRLLAGAGGGAWTAVSEGFYGLFLGYLFLGLAAILATFLAWALFTLAGSTGSRTWINLSGSTAFAAIAWAFAANRAGRAAVLVAADRSRRRVGVLAPPIALAGTAFLAWLAIAVVDLSLDWPSVVGVLVIPAAFAIGVLSARDGGAWKWRPKRAWRALALVVVGFLAIYIGAVLLAPAAVVWPDDGLNVQTAFRFSRIGPTAENSPVTGGSWIRPFGRTVHQSWETDPGAISQWRDLRVELWRAETPDGPISADAIRPAAVNPVETADGVIEASIDMPRYRDLGAAWVVLTGVNLDGRRVQLVQPTSSPVEFRGTILDWFSAGDTPDR